MMMRWVPVLGVVGAAACLLYVLGIFVAAMGLLALLLVAESGFWGGLLD